MSRLWNGKDLDQEVPELGLRLKFASLIPEFAVQLMESGLAVKSDALLLAPLDDLKAWLRTQNPGEAGLLHEVRELLLAQEDKDRVKAAAAGLRFDQVDYDLTQMQADETYEHFNIEWARNILALVLEEADALQAFSQAELGLDFSIALSFHLPDPRKHPVFKASEIEEALQRFGAPKAVLDGVRGKGKRPETSATLLLELAGRGKAHPPKPLPKVGVVRVGIADPRAGDEADAALCLVYPRELEGYFLMSFDALRKQLTLKDEE